MANLFRKAISVAHHNASPALHFNLFVGPFPKPHRLIGMMQRETYEVFPAPKRISIAIGFIAH